MFVLLALRELFVICLIVSSVVFADDIKYKVVSYVPSNYTAGVMIDGQVYPLKVQDESSLYFAGKGPVAQSGYKYVVLDGANNVIEQENFTRAPVTDGDTCNEYYNRSWNSMNLTQLPTLLEPLSIIHRVDSDLHIDGQIPTIHITGNQSDIDYMQENLFEKIKILLDMTYISPNDVKTFKDIKFSISGHSTRSASKLSYQIKIKKSNGSLYEYRRLKLRSMAFDDSYMRDQLSYEIADKIGLPTSKSSYARLYLNDQPIGLFQLVENFKNPWIRNEFNDGKKNFKQGTFFVADFTLGGSGQTSSGGVQALPGGASINSSNITVETFPLNGRRSDLSYLGDNVALYEAPYKVKEDPSVGKANYTRIMELAKFISQQPNNTLVDDSYSDAWEKVFNVESAIRELALEIAISDLDGYLFMGNNYILYDDLENDRFVMSGQDFDLSMGLLINHQTMDGNFSNYMGFSERPLTTRLFKIPKYKQRFEELLYNITSKLVNPEVMFPRIDALAALISEDVEWDQSLPRVTNNTYSIVPSVPFSIAINGTHPDDMPVDRSNNTLASKFNGRGLFLKEWLQTRSENTLTFFKEINKNKE